MPNRKNIEISVKYSEQDNVGYISGYASTFDRIPDSYGDIVAKGAFLNSLKRLEESGRSIPLLWAHQMSELDSYIGVVIEMHEDDNGLYFNAKFDDTKEAQRIRQLYKDGRLSKFSFAYDTLDCAPVELEDGFIANELRELEIYEVSCVLVPANSFAEVTDIKSANLDEKACRRNNRKDENTLKQVIELLKSLLDEDEDINNDDDDSENNDDVNAEKAKEQEVINEKKSSLLQLIDNMNL